MSLPEEFDPNDQGRGPNWMSDAKSIGEAQMQTIKNVGTLVDENPKQAALIVRDWLNNAA
jgi:flagellar M-ring protein FliF